MSRATGTVVLQGGGEFSPACREMDAAVLARVDGPVVVTALAGAVGRDYATATAHGVAHYRALGADVTGAPDVRADPDGALAVLRTARLLVLPGGSPSRLLDALVRTPVGQLLHALLARGGAVSGASAGAMVLGAWTVLPEGPGGPRAVPGLGVVPGCAVVPHWTAAGRSDWLAALRAAAPAGLQVLGLPEESGVVLADGTMTAAGRAPSRLVKAGEDLQVGESRDFPAGERPGGG